MRVNFAGVDYSATSSSFALAAKDSPRTVAAVQSAARAPAAGIPHLDVNDSSRWRLRTRLQGHYRAVTCEITATYQSYYIRALLPWRRVEPDPDIP